MVVTKVIIVKEGDLEGDGNGCMSYTMAVEAEDARSGFKMEETKTTLVEGGNMESDVYGLLAYTIAVDAEEGKHVTA